MGTVTDHYRLYLDDTIKLAKTLVIKSMDSVDSVNDLIKLKFGDGGVDINAPETWKYYLNICGEYHYSDTMMSVTSLDTLETINFTKTNLLVHTATAEAYQYGTRYYQTLIARYPEQEQLLLGILYPADLETAVDAEEGTILTYPKELVEAQEITLIRDLETWIKRYLVRWHVRSFGTSDSLYPAAQHAILYLNIVPRLLNLRLRRCKSNEAHSFHIRQYLASNGRLDRYMDYMTLKQALFLYRNIAYIDHHAGHTDVFKWLITKLLSDRYIPIAEYSMRHLNTYDESYYPMYQFRKRPLNTQYNVPEKDYFSLEELLSKETQTASGNQIYSADQYTRIDEQFKTSLSSVVQTKDLESSMVDYSGVAPYSLTDVLMNEWAHLVSKNLYTTSITFKDPTTSEYRTLSSSDAFVYMLYITIKALGGNIQRVPSYIVRRAQRTPKAVVCDLMSVVDTRYIATTELATKLLTAQPNIKRCYSKSAFYTLCSQIHQAMLQQWYLVSRTEHMYRRGLVSNMINQIYCDESVQFDCHDQLYSEWLIEKGLPTTEYDLESSLALTTNIFQSATGYTSDPTKLIKNIQKAMLGILTQLSSYSIQIVQEINESTIKALNWPAIRVGDLTATTETSRYIPEGITVVDYHTISMITEEFDVNPAKFIQIADSVQSHSLKIETRIDYRLSANNKDLQSVNIGPFIIEVDYVGKDPAVYAKSGFAGYEFYLALSDDEKLSITDIYLSTAEPSPKLNTVGITDIVMFNTLDGLKPLPITNAVITDF